MADNDNKGFDGCSTLLGVVILFWLIAVIVGIFVL